MVELKDLDFLVCPGCDGTIFNAGVAQGQERSGVTYTRFVQLVCPVCGCALDLGTTHTLSEIRIAPGDPHETPDG